MKNILRKLFLSTIAVTVTTGCAIAGGNAVAGKTGHTSVTELKWMDSGFGPTVSPVFGDFSKSNHITYVKFPAGMKTPAHTHSHDYVGLVITGVSMHWEPGKPETKKPLSAGSHWFMPGGVQHISECLPGSECIMAIYQKNRMDFTPVQ